MAATNQTENLGLNQWEPDDYILREDFNSDNQKIDEAISGMSPRVKLMEIVTESNCSILEVDVTQIDWGAYDAVRVDMDISCSDETKNHLSGINLSSKTSGTNVSCYQAQYTANGYTSGYIGWYEFNLYGKSHLFLYTGQDAEQSIKCETKWPEGASYGYCPEVTFSDLSKIRLLNSNTNYSLAAGSKITFWGCK